MIEFLRLWFSQDWEPLASGGVGMCLKLRVCLIFWIRSMHKANALLQKQQRDAFWPVLCGQSGIVIWFALTVSYFVKEHKSWEIPWGNLSYSLCVLRMLILVRAGQCSWAAGQLDWAYWPSCMLVTIMEAEWHRNGWRRAEITAQLLWQFVLSFQSLLSVCLQRLTAQQHTVSSNVATIYCPMKTIIGEL